MEFLELSGNCVHMKWKAPKDNGGRPVTQFIVERRAVGKKSWIKVGEVDGKVTKFSTCLLYTSDAADEDSSV